MSARALEFLALTASRSQELRGARREEIDLEHALWTVPAHRMKMEREHLVPLPEKAMVLLSRLPRLQGNPLVFPAPRGGELSDMSLSAVMKRMHASELAAGRAGWLDKRNRRPAVPHGLRLTFRDWAAENAYSREMAEIALAHRVGSEVERSYLRTELLENRRDIMRAWSEFLSG
ncbi:site-specific integrase [Limimaricola variabilis]|uniref:tyrosine-type recombinase/integrase n=1 Tax=Limimaricola variabilis TaxID=1492771 RepID=UPI002AC9D4AB|nr:site-specific integrase [Limimaricola variabilis]WPY96100.1 site-specific integrase [Limimaricola variabilis]